MIPKEPAIDVWMEKQLLCINLPNHQAALSSYSSERKIFIAMEKETLMSMLLSSVQLSLAPSTFSNLNVFTYNNTITILSLFCSFWAPFHPPTLPHIQYKTIAELISSLCLRKMKTLNRKKSFYILYKIYLFVGEKRKKKFLFDVSSTSSEQLKFKVFFSNFFKLSLSLFMWGGLWPIKNPLRMDRKKKKNQSILDCLIFHRNFVTKFKLLSDSKLMTLWICQYRTLRLKL